MENENLEQEDFAAVRQLIASDDYRRLLTIEPAFNVFTALDAKLKENASSSALRYLLDSSEDHGLGTAFLDAWLGEILLAVLDGDAEPSRKLKISARLLRCKGISSKAVTEPSFKDENDNTRRMDIRIETKDASGSTTAIIGVENKHWAAEQEGQVAAYRRHLAAKAGKDVIPLVLFLTPHGSSADTAGGQDIGCLYVPCSYETVLEALLRCEDRAYPEPAILLRGLRHHLAQRFGYTGHSDGAQGYSLARKLYQNEDHRRAIESLREVANVSKGTSSLLEVLKQNRDHERTFKTLLKYRPDGWELLRLLDPRVGDLLRPHHGSTRLSTYPKRKSVQLVQAGWGFQGWDEVSRQMGFYITYMLRTYEDKDGWNSGMLVYPLVTLWFNTASRRKENEHVIKELGNALPDQGRFPEDFKTKAWSGLHVLRIGRPHRLVALGESDASAMLKVLRELFDKTGAEINKWVEEHRTS
jgi:hypothetical protein